MRENSYEKLRTGRHIFDVISHFLGKSAFKQKGSLSNQTCVTNCPFHTEKTPSFVVVPMRNYFRCFGCGEGGDTLGFVKRYRNCDDKEALAIISQILGIPFFSGKTNHTHARRRDRKKTREGRKMRKKIPFLMEKTFRSKRITR